jgi:ParB family chromosome partitioning protein
MATSNTNNNGPASANGKPALAGVELREIPLSKIVVAEGFNPRGEVHEDAELLALAETMRQRGCLQPIRVRATATGDYVLIAGARRYRAAALAALTQIPAAVVPVSPAGESERVELLVDAMVENELRSDLNPLQRALGYQAMIDGGLSIRGVAERLGGKTRRASREQRIKEHLAILALPEDLRTLVAGERIPLLAIKALVGLCRVHEDLARSAVAAVLDAGEHSEPYTWSEIVAEPLAIAVSNLQELPAGLFNTARSYPLECFTLGEKAQKDLAAYEKLTGGRISAIRFTRDLREQAGVLGAMHDCGWSAIIAGQDVGDRLAEDYIAATLKAERARARRERQSQTQATTTSSNGSGADREPVAQESEEEREERRSHEAKVEREAQQEQRERAIRFNLELGVLAFKHLSRIKVEERVLRILASVDLGGSLRGIATRGARLALPGWVTQTTQRNGNTKTTYLDDHEATGKALEFLQGAQSPGDIAGRTLTLIALAALGDEDAIAASRRSHYTLSFNGAWAARAERDLHAIVRERIQEGQLPALDDALSQRMANDETDAHLEVIGARLQQLSESELDDAVADAERAWGPHSVKTYDLRDQIRPERDRRNGLDTNTQAEQDDASEQSDEQPREIPAAAQH